MPPTLNSRGHEYLYFPMEHNEFAPAGVIGNRKRVTAEKGEEIFERFSTYLAEAVDEIRKIRSRSSSASTC